MHDPENIAANDAAYWTILQAVAWVVSGDAETGAPSHVSMLSSPDGKIARAAIMAKLQAGELQAVGCKRIAEDRPYFMPQIKGWAAREHIPAIDWLDNPWSPISDYILENIRVGTWGKIMISRVAVQKAFSKKPAVSRATGGADLMSDKELRAWIKDKERQMGRRPPRRLWEENKEFFQERGVSKAIFNAALSECFPQPDLGRPTKK